MLKPTHKTLKTLFIASCFTLSSSFILAKSISAAPGQSTTPTEAYTITTTAIPPRLEISAKPGATVQKTIKVQNTSADMQGYTTEVEDFVVGSDGKTPLPLTQKVDNRYSLASWVTLSPTKFTLKSNESQVMDVLVQIPADALPGGHYAMVLHQPSTPNKNNDEALFAQGSSGIAPRVGTLVYLTVEGDVHEEAFIRNFKSPRFLEFGPVRFTYSLENRSDIHIQPQSSIEVKDVFGRVMDTIKVEERNVFPMTTRDFEARYERYWGFGPYRATLVVPYGSKGAVTQSLISFWIIPVRLILGILLLIAAASSIIILIRRFFLHKLKEDAQKISKLQKQVKDLEEQKNSSDLP